jgi:hypothetical protein
VDKCDITLSAMPSSSSSSRASATSGLKGNTASVDVIVFKVPDGVQGCYVPVSVRVAGVMSNFGTISVTPSGKACSDPTGLAAADFQKVLNGATLTVADVFLARIGVKAALSGMGNFQGNLDFADGHFRRYGSVADLLTSVNRAALAGSMERSLPWRCNSLHIR